MIAQALLLGGLLAVTSVGPGLLIVRKLRFNPLEKSCSAIALSLALVYLVALAAFVVHLGNAARWFYAVACVFATIVSFPDIRALLATRRARQMLLAFLVVLAWSLALLAFCRHYAGGTWSEDWIVHYRKSLGFLSLSRVELDRPPAMNLIWSFYLALAGIRFENFQLAGTYLNTLIVLPCMLLAGAMVRRGSRRPILIAALFMLNPLFTVNATYTWTKLFAGFYSVLGVGFYLAAMRKRDPVRLAWSAGLLAVGCLVHFAGVPYAAFVAGHCLIMTRRRAFLWRRRSLKARPRVVLASNAAILAAGCGACVLASWYGWTLLTFGPQANVVANPTLDFFAKHSTFENAERVATNVVNTLVPLPLRMRGTWFVQPSRFGHVRDHAFMAYEDNLLVSMGCVGGIVAAWLAYLLLRRPAAPPINYACAAGALVLLLGVLAIPRVRDVFFVALPNVPLVIVASALVTYGLARICTNIRASADPLSLSPEQRFWRWFLFVVPLIAIAAQDRSSEFGVTHICLEPLTLLGVTLVAAMLPNLPRWTRVLIAAGAAVDFAIGVLLHFALQHADPRAAGLLDQAVANWDEKRSAGLTFVGDHVAATGALMIEAALLIGAAALIALILRPVGSRSRACGRS
jgi:hypothetical protein